MSIYFLQRSSYCRSASAKFTAAPFFVPPQAPTGRPPDWGWCLLFAPTDPPTVRTLSEMVKKPRRSSLWSPGIFWIAPSSSPRKAVWSLSWPTYWKRQILVKSGANRLTDTSWAWASFMTLSWRSFSNSAAISAMDTVVVRFIWSAAARSHI